MIQRVAIQEASTRADDKYYAAGGAGGSSSSGGDWTDTTGKGGGKHSKRVPSAPLTEAGDETGAGAVKSACWTCGLAGHRAVDCPSGATSPRTGKGDGGKGKGKSGKDGKTGKDGKSTGKTGKDGKSPGKTSNDGKTGKGKTGKDGKSPGKDAKGKGGKGNIPAGPVTADMLTSKKGIPLTVGELANKFAQLAKAKAAAPPPGAADASSASQQQRLSTPPTTFPPHSTHLHTHLRKPEGTCRGKGWRHRGWWWRPIPEHCLERFGEVRPWGQLCMPRMRPAGRTRGALHQQVPSSPEEAGGAKTPEVSTMPVGAGVQGLEGSYEELPLLAPG